MQLISEMGYDPAFAKQASQAGYIFRDGGYFTPDQIQAYENIPSRQRTDIIHGGMTQQQVAEQLQQTRMRQTTDQQQQYAIGRQNSLSGSGAQQQLQSMTQRNAATDEALANAKAAPGPGRSAYDQRLQQMMLGSFTPDDPSYQWRMEQGMNNLARSGAAKGMLGSGNMAAELLTFAQGMASQEYGAQFNRLLQASTNATNQYTAAYSVLDRMLQQQQAQQGLGLEGERMAQGWGQLAQGWGGQNLGYTNADTQEYAATTGAQANAATLGLRRDAFNAEQQRLDNWNQGQGAALMQGAGRQPQQPAQQSYYVQQSNPGVGGYGPVQNTVAPQPPSGTGYIQNNSTGAVTQIGGQSNSYGYDAVYGD
jgi:hypothetical protein